PRSGSRPHRSDERSFARAGVSVLPPAWLRRRRRALFQGHPGTRMNDIEEQFGHIDIYLFDQLLRGRIRPGMRVLDAGCGQGRNLVYLLQNGYEVFASDEDPGSVAAVQQLAAALAPALPSTNFRVEPVERSTFPAA